MSSSTMTTKKKMMRLLSRCQTTAFRVHSMRNRNSATQFLGLQDPRRQSRRVSSLSHDRRGQPAPTFFVKLLLKHGCCPCTSFAALIAALFFWSSTAHAESFYPVRPADPRAVDFTAEAFGAHADGIGDDSDALQRAIDRVQETTGAGVLLIPEGRYRLSKTVYVWQGIRLLGYGAARPVFVLAKDTPGFQEGNGRYMVHFADNRPDPGGPIVDATEFTFFSGMSNIDFELQDGNPAAIAVRFHVAQHSELTHMNFRVGTARAAVEDIGNQASDIHIEGGEYGIITKRTAPVWQFLLMDSSFKGQRAAAIKTQEAGFTLIRVDFSNMPVALQIAPGEVEQLYGRDLRMQNIRDAAFVAGNARNAHSAVTLVNIACSDVPRFRWRKSLESTCRPLRGGSLFAGADDRGGWPGKWHLDAPQGTRSRPPGAAARDGHSRDPRHG